MIEEEDMPDGTDGDYREDDPAASDPDSSNDGESAAAIMEMKPCLFTSTAPVTPAAPMILCARLWRRRWAQATRRP